MVETLRKTFGVTMYSERDPSHGQFDMAKRHPYCQQFFPLRPHCTLVCFPNHTWQTCARDLAHGSEQAWFLAHCETHLLALSRRHEHSVVLLRMFTLASATTQPLPPYGPSS